MIFNRLHPRILVFLNLDYEVNIREEIYLKLEIYGSRSILYET
jgi:hypothetical protein